MAEDLYNIGEDKTLLLVDDDDAFLKRLAKAMEKRGFDVETADSVAAGKAIATARPPAYAVCDLPSDAALRVHGEGVPLLAWTVRTAADRATAARYADQIIFEGFDPAAMGTASAESAGTR